MAERIALNQDNGTVALTHRIVRVEVEVSQTVNDTKIIHNTLLFNGLNVRFNILKRRCSSQNKCDVSICNLNKEQVEYLTTINGWNTPASQVKILRVWAGYVDDKGKENVGLIFEGNIVRAIPTTEPDVWLECNCISGYANQLKTNSLGFQGDVSVKDICTKVANELGLRLEWKAGSASNKIINGFYHAGAVQGLIDELAKIGGIAVYEEDGNLVVDTDEPAKVTEGQPVRLFSEVSGMISHPEPDQYGVKFKVLLDPSLKCGDPVQLESAMIPAANGVYYINALKHYGELRGQAFYTEIDARSYSADK